MALFKVISGKFSAGSFAAWCGGRVTVAPCLELTVQVTLPLRSRLHTQVLCALDLIKI